MTVRNYQKDLKKLIEKNMQEEKMPKLLLHSCCAPCSSYVMEYLSKYFQITIYYFNPNIFPPEEYEKRVREQENLIHKMNLPGNVKLLEGEYRPEEFFQMAKGLEKEPEGGERCFLCYEMRLRKTAQEAVRGGYDYFATTLSISPLKNAGKLNEIGEKVGKEWGALWLPSDFKKKNGYKRSVELSKEYHLYRQDYCGCVYSKAERTKNL
ncbi:MAG: epoxyqueuosine reductase QueH [Lachnoclostridium edouardi]|uniref:epoxyqueuosine reductase QueH n=1 Tax=Lachnoclostridium edouardi TaxID=1926283 RepID=UPI0026DD3574|nr:epoxyqueuosine reductase QueH [Lachnoclostridium edouardi]MDO4279925.1 epoxyqueuosine reductase QueH [Lachnoclostridium edouardi]